MVDKTFKNLLVSKTFKSLLVDKTFKNLEEAMLALRPKVPSVPQEPKQRPGKRSRRESAIDFGEVRAAEKMTDFARDYGTTMVQGKYK